MTPAQINFLFASGSCFTGSVLSSRRCRGKYAHRVLSNLVNRGSESQRFHGVQPEAELRTTSCGGLAAGLTFYQCSSICSEPVSALLSVFLFSSVRWHCRFVYGSRIPIRFLRSTVVLSAIIQFLIRMHDLSSRRPVETIGRRSTINLKMISRVNHYARLSKPCLFTGYA